MNGLLDKFLVGLVLLAGFGYAGYALGPKALRRRFLRRTARRLEAAAGRSSGSCGGCNNCGDGSATVPGTAGVKAASDVNIPVSRIGKRR